jgi:hypothetical protein
MKRTWKIINEDRGKIKKDKGIHSIKVDNKVITNQMKSQMFLTSTLYL